MLETLWEQSQSDIIESSESAKPGGNFDGNWEA